MDEIFSTFRRTGIDSGRSISEINPSEHQARSLFEEYIMENTKAIKEPNPIWKEFIVAMLNGTTVSSVSRRTT
jgi:hypothetical protein